MGWAKDTPPSSSSTRSPATAWEPEVGSVTRSEVLGASCAFNHPSPSESSAASDSVGALGATVSSVKSAPWLLVLRLPAASTTTVLTSTAPWPRVCTSAVSRVSACHCPDPVPVRVTTPSVPVSVTVQAAPDSVRTLATP